MPPQLDVGDGCLLAPQAGWRSAVIYSIGGVEGGTI